MGLFFFPTASRKVTEVTADCSRVNGNGATRDPRGILGEKGKNNYKYCPSPCIASSMRSFFLSFFFLLAILISN